MPFRPLLLAAMILGVVLPTRGADPTPAELRVMTFNVLCSFCDQSNFDPWLDRLDYERDIIARHKPDLIGFQEISKAEEVQQIADRNPEYKAFFYQDPPGPKAKAYPDATLFYRADRFEALETGTYWLGREPDKAWSRGWAKAAFWRLVVWAKLKDKTTGRELYFSTTHYDNNQPNQPNSAPLMLDRVAPWAEKLPCIVVGDFNSRPDSQAYKTLIGGKDGQGFKMANAYDLAEERTVDAEGAQQPPFDPADRIDHVWLSGTAKFKVKRWTAVGRVYGAKQRPPSDHNAVVAILEY